MDHPTFIAQVRDDISKGKLKLAIAALRTFLDKSPRLNYIIQQSSRYYLLKEDENLGLISREHKNIERNKISLALLDLLKEIELESTKPIYKEEIQQALPSITNFYKSKNIVMAPIQAGRDAIVGDNNKVDNSIHHHYAEKKIPHQLTAYPPNSSGFFIGREDELKAIYEKLFFGDNLLLLVNGRGGIGKTTLAAHYYRAYQQEYAHVGWVLCQNSVTEAVLKIAFSLGVQFPPTADTEAQMEQLLAAMARLKDPCLLIIDNANNLKDLQNSYRTLLRCPNFHILLTSRITEFAEAELYRIEGLPLPEAIQLFKEYYSQIRPEEEALIPPIYKAVNGNTLVLELLAKNLNLFRNKLKTHYSLAQLLEDLQQRDVLSLSKSRGVKTIYIKGSNKPETIIEGMYDLVHLEENEQALLSIFSVLPPENLPFEKLEEVLPSYQELDLQLLDLAQKGWIEYDDEEGAFKCSPVIQAIVRKKNRESLLDDCEEIIGRLKDKLANQGGHVVGVSHEEALIYAAWSESIVDNMPFFETYELFYLAERAGVFYQSIGNLNFALRNFESYQRLAQELQRSNPENLDYKNGLAISYEKLGETHSSLGNLDAALKYFEERSRLGKELSESYPSHVGFKNGLAISYANLARFFQNKKNDTNLARDYYIKAKVIWIDLVEDFPQFVEFQKYRNMVEKDLDNL